MPDHRGPAPIHGKPNGVETGPQVRLTDARRSPQVIHASLLEDPHDKAMLRYYTTGQLAVIDVKSRAVKKIGAPAMIKAVDASPDGQYFRVTMMTEPFSYIVPTSAFGSVQELWDANGKLVAKYAITGHYDVVPKVDDDGEQLSELVRNTDRPLAQRRYIAVDPHDGDVVFLADSVRQIQRKLVPKTSLAGCYALADLPVAGLAQAIAAQISDLAGGSKI